MSSFQFNSCLLMKVLTVWVVVVLASVKEAFVVVGQTDPCKPINPCRTLNITSDILAKCNLEDLCGQLTQCKPVEQCSRLDRLDPSQLCTLLNQCRPLSGRLQLFEPMGVIRQCVKIHPIGLFDTIDHGRAIRDQCLGRPVKKPDPNPDTTYINPRGSISCYVLPTPEKVLHYQSRSTVITYKKAAFDCIIKLIWPSFLATIDCSTPQSTAQAIVPLNWVRNQVYTVPFGAKDVPPVTLDFSLTVFPDRKSIKCVYDSEPQYTWDIHINPQQKGIKCETTCRFPMG